MAQHAEGSTEQWKHLKKSSRSRRATTSMSTVTSSSSSTCTAAHTHHIFDRDSVTTTRVVHSTPGKEHTEGLTACLTHLMVPAKSAKINLLPQQLADRNVMQTHTGPITCQIGDNVRSKGRQKSVMWHANNRRLCQHREEMLAA